MINSSLVSTENYVGSSAFSKERSDEFYPAGVDNNIPSYMTHNLRVNYQLQEDLMVYFGVNSLTDKKPFNLSGLNRGSLLYDAIGRTFNAGVNYRF
ncbi:hypothetical protein ACSLBF_04470 [Pseudoalteromonas sp. T1lg65]|uniref:hypothetical protein n=1 Tax=Pseudoalteromonas sp. T1lg65 TaxID=2077101 RepID=UPI003F7A394A